MVYSGGFLTVARFFRGRNYRYVKTQAWQQSPHADTMRSCAACPGPARAFKGTDLQHVIINQALGLSRSFGLPACMEVAIYIWLCSLVQLHARLHLQTFACSTVGGSFKLRTTTDLALGESIMEVADSSE